MHPVSCIFSVLKGYELHKNAVSGRKALTFSYDNGVDADISVIKIMNRYGYKGTFDINTGIFASERTTMREPGAYSRRCEQSVFKRRT